MRPYGLMADVHFHNWSAFSTIESDGVNSRLGILLKEICRCAEETGKAGGDTIIVAGDMFHSRGNITPSVLNPVMDTLDRLVKGGFKFVILAGNHDLEGKNSDRLSSAVTALEGVGCTVINDVEAGARCMDGVKLIPWIEDIKALKEVIESVTNKENIDLILHAPIDGVIAGLPDHGLTAEWLTAQGFRRVFSGHYHQHKHLYGAAGAPGGASVSNVYSIGALAHHTWNDVGTKAGFLIVKSSDIRWFKSHAPEFVEISAETDPFDIPILADGNYVRAKINSGNQKDVEELRAYLNDCGAKGVAILPQKNVAATPRTGATIKAGASLEVSVTDFIKTQGYSSAEKLSLVCQDILAQARAAV